MHSILFYFCFANIPADNFKTPERMLTCLYFFALLLFLMFLINFPGIECLLKHKKKTSQAVHNVLNVPRKSVGGGTICCFLLKKGKEKNTGSWWKRSFVEEMYHSNGIAVTWNSVWIEIFLRYFRVNEICWIMFKVKLIFFFSYIFGSFRWVVLLRTCVVFSFFLIQSYHLFL